MNIFGYTETRCPRRSQAGVSDKRQTRARRRVIRANSKKSCPDASRSASAISLYMEALFSMSYEHHNSDVDVRILSSTTKVRPSDL
jgi:hypothetical protein